MAHDGNNNIFITNYNMRTVQILSLNSLRTLFSSVDISYLPHRLNVDKECQLLYVGHDGNTVSVFSMTYNDVVN